MVILRCPEFLEHYLQRRTTTGNVSETATTTEVPFTDPDETAMGNSDLEGENMLQLKEKGKDKN
jgi:hypothetical protein